MNVLEINAVAYGSTGNIMFSIADKLKSDGDNVVCTSGFTWIKCKRKDFFITSGIIEKTIHIILARLSGRIGFFSKHATRRLIRKMNRFKPDVIHLHNLHGWFINLPMLFDYIKTNKIPVVWTLHDCWALTGHCPHFDMIGCDKWKTECRDCPQHRQYPQSLIDLSTYMYNKKKSWFTGVDKLTVVTPSEWLKNIVLQSYMKDYEVCVINNGIDTSVFKPSDSNFREKNNCRNKHIVLGVSYEWNVNKGIDVFRKMAESLDDEYRIVLVGTDESIEKQLPENIIPIRRTQNREQLAEIYSAADVFVNPTREDNFPTVNIEALACGTPVITFDVGGSAEIIDENCGCSVPTGDIATLVDKVRMTCEERPYSEQACINRAQCFDRNEKFSEYARLLHGSVR